ncbi:AsmA family protein [Undibacter mobilis]|uniref:AsmA family protein n=1 Tax=Undibacter mobilis TaxID=2292256 RepID=A0A371BAG5_9BRAD|nr:AsmA family protein [Undibacter mobilis]RDV04615.1 AsmA family protein [Undibacter mobilis]
MTAFAGIRRLGFVLIAVGAITAGVLTTAGYLISPDTVRTEVLNRIRAATGLDPQLGGKVSVSLFPKGSVSFSDVVLGDPKRPALTAERLTARLRFFPLLIGKVEIADVSLEKPTIAIDFERDGGSNWSALIDALVKAQKPRANHSVAGFSEMRIDDGTVLLRKDEGRSVETLYAVDLSLAWPSISKSFGATGHFVWHGEKIDASIALADFAAALAGNRSGIKLRLSGAPMKVAFEGAFSVKPTIKVEGTLAADAASFRRAMTWAGHEPLPGGGFGRFAIKAQTTVLADSVSLSSVNVELDGNSAEGVLSFSSEGRQSLQGTLAADTLDLTPYISTIRLSTANQRAWNDAQLTPDGLNGLDFDLRLSAANVIMGSAKIGRTAIGANLRSGKLTVSIGEALAYGGVIKGSLALNNSSTGVDFKSQLQFADVDLESCLGQLFGLKRLEGKGTMSMALDGAGESVLAMTRTLAGTATLTGRDGAIAGINVEQLLKRLERRPLSGGGEFRTGRTPYDRIDIMLRIAQGTVDVQDMKVESAAVRLILAGTASIPDRELDLKGTAALAVASRAGSQPFGLPFVVQGSWDDPIMLPDAEALIRRSGAAAPLLNAVRERNARDTVRSAIERLTGGGVQPAAENAPAEPKP